MKKLVHIKRPFAFLMLLIFTADMLMPLFAFPLTGGPVQPEIKGFEPAGTTNLVDPFTGDFTYNIPLMDVGGYPINIAYHSGSGMDDEASWVGFGWSLNPGVIDRQMRGLPDDFNGVGKDADKITREFHMRNDITGGVNFSFDPEVFGFNFGSALKVGVQAGVFYNNKRGLGIEFGLNANAPLLSNGKANAGTNTAGLSGSAHLSFNSQKGASFNPSINFSITGKNLSETEANTSRLSLGGAFQSRAGLQAITLGQSFRNENVYKETKTGSFSRSFEGELASSSVSYAAQAFLPETQANYFNESYSVSPQFGPEAWGFFAGLQLTGHYSLQKVANPIARYNAYGFMHSSEAAKDGNALMDFNREKNVPYFDGVPNLPVPVATPDLFMVHTQDGSAQYRAFAGSAGIFSDHEAVNSAISASLGIEVGAGAGFKTGADLQASLSKTITGRWKTGARFLFEDDNRYDGFGNFIGPAAGKDPSYEPVYFKRAGEMVAADGGIYDKINGPVPVKVKITGSASGASAANILSADDHMETPVTQTLTRDKREPRNNTFSFLTAEQVNTAGLDKTITDYYQAAGGFKPLLQRCSLRSQGVQQPYKKPHHIGEITVTDENGARKVYGLPVYDIYQEDVSFSVKQNNNTNDKKRGLVSYTAADASLKNNNGLDHFYSKEIIPAYAQAFLLTGILSPDYVDLTGNGITDDDLGTAIKFNYWRKTDGFQWRTPYAAGKANYNEGLMSDKTDDRGNYSYGKKELWYVHSVESNSMVAVFETGDREDALGADAFGVADDAKSNRQQYLKVIRLYAKADWYKNQSTAVPLKTVHFVYDYSLFSDPSNPANGIPNNTREPVNADESIAVNRGGKLSLKKIYFTYQGNTKGLFQPYEFQYDFNRTYDWRQYDRWGNYKNSDDNNPAGTSNDFFPYSTQDKTKADANAALWQLTKIITPAAGIITVQYESDDYSWVQNRRAMEMYPLAGLGNRAGDNSGYYKTDKIFVQLPEPVPSDEALRARFFDNSDAPGSQHLFFKILVNLKDKKESSDFVSGYADIENVQTDVRLAPGHNDIAEIKVRKIKGEAVATEYHPVAKAAWQFMRLNTPVLVYPGYNVREDLAPAQFVKALLGAITAITELLAPFDTRAEINKLAPSVDLSKSWVRLSSTTNTSKQMNGKSYYGKLGGGSRVKEISMSDEWSSMSQSDAPTAVYGMVYDYTSNLQLSDGETVIASSGVASYEPMIGNEENPFHQPSGYQQKVALGPDNAFFIDEPLCESWFPAAGIGYSKVTVRNKAADGSIDATGYTVNEFYTQKDYPVIVQHTPIDVQQFGGASILQLLKIKKNNSRVLSQGYAISLNDMHGKPKSEKIFDRGGNELTSLSYYYKSFNEDAPEKELNNEVMVLKQDGTSSNAVIGRDVEMYTDMRSQTSVTTGVNLMVNVDAIYLLFAIVPVPVLLPLPNAEYTGFRSASSIKVIQQYGVLDKVIKRQNGSQITTENLAWDAETGRVLLTRTQNEFDDPVYTLDYPAHWAYEKGMGLAYKNLGLVITNFSATGGNISANSGIPFLVSGDELLIRDNAGVSDRYWVNNTGTATHPALVLINKEGVPATVSGNSFLVRSGRRNCSDESLAELVSLANPVKNGKIDITVFTKVLKANAHIYGDEWAINAKNLIRSIQECPIGYAMDFFGRCYKDSIVVGDPSYTINTTATRQKNAIYSTCGTYLTNLTTAYSNGSAPDPAGTGKTLLSAAGTWRNGNGNCTAGNQGDFDGPLNRCGIWPAEHSNNNYYNQWVGIRSKVFISRFDVSNKSADGKTGYLFLGFGSQHSIEVRIDNVLVAARNRNNDNNNTSPARTWRIKPISVSLDQQHEIFIKVKNELPNSEAVMGVELYDNTFNELKSSSCINEVCLPCNFCSGCRTRSNLDVNQTCEGALYANSIWSTKCLVGKRFDYHSMAAGAKLTDFDPVCAGTLSIDNNCALQCSSLKRIYAQKINRTYCDPPVGQVFNPYTTGLRGNWRLQSSFAYHTDRTNSAPYIKPDEPDIIGKTDIRRSGTYASFSAFWTFDGQRWTAASERSPADMNWVMTEQSTAFNQKGQDLESRDALKRYSAVQFGYLQSAVTAQATNARYTDIGYDGFEDYDFGTDNCTNADSCNQDGHFSLRKLSRLYSSDIAPDQTWAHTGRYSLRVNANAPYAAITSTIGTQADAALYTLNGNAMQLAANGLLTAFRPMAGKQYLLSVWIKDDGNVQQGPQTEPGKAAMEIVSGGQTFQTMKAGPRVEGWRKCEVLFLIPRNATDIRIRFRPGTGTAWFDDLRIQPFDAQLKTYAYDPVSMRLWAELDENNFASFYEYNDEGLLIRVKKETEKGIMTVKEGRTSLKMKR